MNFFIIIFHQIIALRCNQDPSLFLIFQFATFLCQAIAQFLAFFQYKQKHAACKAVVFFLQNSLINFYVFNYFCHSKRESVIFVPRIFIATNDSGNERGVNASNRRFGDFFPPWFLTSPGSRVARQLPLKEMPLTHTPTKRGKN